MLYLFCFQSFICWSVCIKPDCHLAVSHYWSFFLQRLHVRVVPFFLTKFHTHFETETPHQSFLMKLVFLSVPQQLLMCFLLNSRSLNPFKLAWDQSYRTTTPAKKAFQVYSWVYTLYPRGISLYMMLNMTETNVKALYGAKESYRDPWSLLFFLFYSVQSLWESVNWFSSHSAGCD